MTKYYKKGYPRPQFVRDSFISLDGEWNFRFDPSDEGLESGWQRGFQDVKIIVPFTYESKASAVERMDVSDIVWYSRTVEFYPDQSRRVLLHFEGADYETRLWVNGTYLGSHEGGYCRFTFDITAALREGDNTLTVRIADSLSATQPRGKQRWLQENYDCWYTPSTGIWKSVWAEEVSRTYIKKVRLLPCYDENAVELEYTVDGGLCRGLELETSIFFGEETVYCGREQVRRETFSKKISLLNDQIKWKVRYWRPGSPNLYDVRFRLLKNGEVTDSAGSYFGLRKISASTGRVTCNNMDIYLKMVLDQGYWKDSLLTPPDEEALIADIRKILEYGYNGVRKHQKIEDERFYYWTDVLGLLVWCEAPSFYEFQEESVERAAREWMEIVTQLENHPSIMAWVPFNESWGIPRVIADKKQQAFTQALYYLTKALDPSRPVIGNDGWEHTKSDIIALHDYAPDGRGLLENWKSPADSLNGVKSFNGERYAFAKGFHYEGQPVILSEFGGIAYGMGDDGWGYGEAELTEAGYLDRFRSLIGAVESMDFICGYCYTQLTDVEQEQNGHMTMDRTDKVDAEKIREIIRGGAK